MPGPMPYLVEKASYFSIIESMLSDPVQRLTVLRELHQGKALAELAGFDSTNLGTPPTPGNQKGTGDGRTPAERIDHLNREWFGMTDAGGNWAKQPGVFPTGFWAGYQGDPEAIMRDALIRAIQVSLGLPPTGPGGDGEPTISAVRQWPIDMYWICQGPWFQCWVLWRQSDNTASEGHVTMVITTPATLGHPLTTKLTRPVDPTQPPYLDPEYASPPPPAARLNRRGMWVIGHEDYTKTVECSTKPSEQGRIVWPEIQWRATDASKVFCVAPAEWEGGVLHDGRPYMP